MYAGFIVDNFHPVLTVSAPEIAFTTDQSTMGVEKTASVANRA